MGTLFLLYEFITCHSPDSFERFALFLYSHTAAHIRTFRCFRREWRDTCGAAARSGKGALSGDGGPLCPVLCVGSGTVVHLLKFLKRCSLSVIVFDGHCDRSICCFSSFLLPFLVVLSFSPGGFTTSILSLSLKLEERTLREPLDLFALSIHGLLWRMM